MGSEYTEKIEKARRVISAAYEKSQFLCVLWSGGKDSTMVLHMARQLGLKLPAVCFRHPWPNARERFVDQLAEEWELELWDWAPSRVTAHTNGDKSDIINHYQISPLGKLPQQHLSVATGINPPEEDNPMCGLETFLSRPLGSFDFPWQGMLHGHKSSDDDPLFGVLSLESDIFCPPGGDIFAAYPLRHLSDEDVFQYHRENGVPFNTSRYNPETGSEFSYGKDYISCCLRCCHPNSLNSVFCPKYKVDLNTVASKVQWEKPEILGSKEI